jgi:hypothetical protein
LGYLPLAKFVAILLLLQDKDQIFLPIALQAAGDFLLARFDSPIPKCCQLVWIAFAGQNGRDDCLSRHSADITQHMGQLNVHLRHRFLDPLNVSPRRAH